MGGYRLERLKKRKARRRRILSLTTIPLLALLFAVGVYTLAPRIFSESPPSPTKSRGGAESKPSTGPVEESPTGVLSEEVTVIAVGDIIFAQRVARIVADKGVDEPFRLVSTLLRGADLTIANLECPLSTRGTPLENKKYTFRGDPGTARGMKEAGIKLVSLANNHILDYGPLALQDTIDVLDGVGIAHAGAGLDLPGALAPAVIEVGGKKISFLSHSSIIPKGFYPSTDRAGIAPAKLEFITQGIRQAKGESDFVICSFHWGIELQDRPQKSQREMAHLAVDAGADLVLGHHPHVLQGIEIYKGRAIVYSLGNFVFDNFRPFTDEAIALKCQLFSGEVKEVKVVPIKIAPFGQPRVAEGEEAEQIIDRLSRISSEFGTTIEMEQGEGRLVLSD